jgi:hypothetical protein
MFLTSILTSTMRIAVALLLLLASSSDAFTSVAKCGSPSRFLGTQMRFTPHNPKRNHVQSSRRSKSSSSSSLHMFLGSDGGILGVGTPELVRFVLKNTQSIMRHACCHLTITLHLLHLFSPSTRNIQLTHHHHPHQQTTTTTTTI